MTTRTFDLGARPRRIALTEVAICAAPVFAVFYVVDLLRQTRHGLTDGAGRPFGDDFVNYWSGAFLSAHGRAGEVYNWAAFHAFEQSAVGAPIDFYHYSYPPVLFVLTAPLALLPYAPALVAWLLAGWLSFYAALRSTATKHALLLAMSLPAVFVNSASGQNGTFTAAILGGGLTLLDRRPFIAGLIFGLLAYKPHLAILLPVALAAGGRWRAIVGAALSVAVLGGLTLWLYPPEVWQAFAGNTAILRQQILEDGTGVWHRMVSVFVFGRRLGASVPAAYALQVATGLIAAACVALVWYRRAPQPLANAALILGTFLTTPYLQDYDLVVAAFVVVWLARNTLALALVVVLPFAAAPVGILTGVAIGPLLILPAFAVAIASALHSQAPAPRSIQACSAG